MVVNKSKSYDHLQVWTEGCIHVFNKSIDNLQVWMEGCIQVFYTLGATWGGIHTMASYNRFSNSCLKSVYISVIEWPYMFYYYIPVLICRDIKLD